MFEDSTFESGSRIKTRSGQWMTLTGSLNGAVLAMLVLTPLIFPEAMPRWSMLTVLTAPPEPPAPQPLPAAVRVTRVPAEMMDEQLRAPRRIPVTIDMVDRKEAPPAPFNVAEIPGLGSDAASTLGRVEMRGPKVQVAPSKQLTISSGVAAGMLIRKTLPVYPPIARAAHVSGTVVLEATIGKDGTIEGLRVVSGHPMLQGAAVDAVRTWVYRPYLLNGQPISINTTIDVTFTLGG